MGLMCFVFLAFFVFLHAVKEGSGASSKGGEAASPISPDTEFELALEASPALRHLELTSLQSKRLLASLRQTEEGKCLLNFCEAHLCVFWWFVFHYFLGQVHIAGAVVSSYLVLFNIWWTREAKRRAREAAISDRINEFIDEEERERGAGDIGEAVRTVKSLIRLGVFLTVLDSLAPVKSMICRMRMRMTMRMTS